jgi:hypothetical protein
MGWTMVRKSLSVEENPLNRPDCAILAPGENDTGLLLRVGYYAPRGGGSGKPADFLRFQ